MKNEGREWFLPRFRNLKMRMIMLSIEEKKHLTKEFSRLFRELFSDERKVWLIDGVHVCDDRTHECSKLSHINTLHLAIARI